MRRGGFLGLVASAALAACASSPSPPLRYYQLRLDPPAGEAVPAPAGSAAEVWQLTSPIRLPDYLDRDVLWQAVGGNGLQPLDGHRWAEPLRTAVPRVLAHDLGALRGSDRVWSGSLPAGIVAGRQVRVEVLEFGPGPDGHAVRLRARWTITGPGGTAPAQTEEAELEVAITGRSPEPLVDAHRLALWRLAQRIAKSR